MSRNPYFLEEPARIFLRARHPPAPPSTAPSRKKEVIVEVGAAEPFEIETKPIPPANKMPVSAPWKSGRGERRPATYPPSRVPMSTPSTIELSVGVSLPISRNTGQIASAANAEKRVEATPPMMMASHWMCILTMVGLGLKVTFPAIDQSHWCNSLGGKSEEISC